MYTGLVFLLNKYCVHCCFKYWIGVRY